MKKRSFCRKHLEPHQKRKKKINVKIQDSLSYRFYVFLPPFSLAQINWHIELYNAVKCLVMMLLHSRIFSSNVLLVPFSIEFSISLSKNYSTTNYLSYKVTKTWYSYPYYKGNFKYFAMGFHEFGKIWESKSNEILEVNLESTDKKDRFAIAILKNKKINKQLPFGKTNQFFTSWDANTMTAKLKS